MTITGEGIMAATSFQSFFRKPSFAIGAQAGVFLFGWVALAVHAQTPDAAGAEPATGKFLELRAGAMRSDNILRTPAAEEEGTIAFAGLGLDLERDGRRLDYTVQSDLDWRRYPNDTFDD